MSEGEDDSQKTEEPSLRKLSEAREKGQVFSSREVNSFLILFAGFIIITAFSTFMGKTGLSEMRVFIENATNWTVDAKGVHIAFVDSMIILGKILGLPFLILVIAAILGPLSQIGFLLSASNLAPKLERISVLKGFGRLFSSKALVEFAKGILKLSITGSIAFLILWPSLAKLKGYAGVDLISSLLDLKMMMIKLIIGILSIMLIVAALDYMYQRSEFMKKMRMSRHEIKEEYRQTEGDPHVKSKLKQLRSERARKRMMAEVPNADVIITNPTHYSIALSYDQRNMNAPICIAKGMDNIALKIREIAKENNIPLVENKPLARGLYDTVEIDEEIPEEYYKAVAKVISYVFNLQQKRV